MAEVREITPLIVLIYRQLYPTEPVATPPPPRADLPRGPYAVLHVANDAPLEVCEAAYKALTKKTSSRSRRRHRDNAAAQRRD